MCAFSISAPHRDGSVFSAKKTIFNFNFKICKHYLRTSEHNSKEEGPKLHVLGASLINTLTQARLDKGDGSAPSEVDPPHETPSELSINYQIGPIH